MDNKRARVQVFQHAAFEGLGSMEAWFAGRGHAVSHTYLHAGEVAPSSDAYDWLVVMGGPMGVHDEALFPWLKGEKRALEKALAAGKPVLGICLGAQLLADVLGAPVTRNGEREIGWHEVVLTDAARGSWVAEALPPRFKPFHWHGDTFALPQGAIPLASSQACANQAFLYGDKALGLQFHPEVTLESIEALLANCAEDLWPGPFVQSAEEIGAGRRGCGAMNALMGLLCEGMEARL